MVLPNKAVTASSRQSCPFRGKVINTAKAKMADILKNEEINTMIYTIGAGVGADFSIEDANYDKINYHDRCGYRWCPYPDLALDIFSTATCVL